MPYIKEEDKELVRNTEARNAGDANFLITEKLQELFMSMGGRYQQIHDISKAVRNVTKTLEGLTLSENISDEDLKYFNELHITTQKCGKLSTDDKVAALAEAMAEFRRRVVAPYEDSCIKRNGDVIRSDLKEKLDNLK